MRSRGRGRGWGWGRGRGGGGGSGCRCRCSRCGGLRDRTGRSRNPPSCRAGARYARFSRVLVVLCPAEPRHRLGGSLAIHFLGSSPPLAFCKGGTQLLGGSPRLQSRSLNAIFAVACIGSSISSAPVLALAVVLGAGAGAGAVSRTQAGLRPDQAVERGLGVARVGPAACLRPAAW